VYARTNNSNKRRQSKGRNDLMTIMQHLQLGACISGSLVPALHTNGDGVTATQVLRSRRRSQPAGCQNTPTLPGWPQNGQQISC